MQQKLEIKAESLGSQGVSHARAFFRPPLCARVTASFMFLRRVCACGTVNGALVQRGVCQEGARRTALMRNLAPYGSCAICHNGLNSRCLFRIRLAKVTLV